MKRTFMLIVCLILIAGTVSASPLMDFSQGKGSIDLTFRPSNDLEFPGGSLDGSNSNFDLGITVGLGNNLAFQWQHQSAKSQTYSGSMLWNGYILAGSLNTELTANQFNVLYKLDKNFAAFIGYTQAKNEIPAAGTYAGSSINGTIPGNNSNGYQIGFTGSFPMGDKMTGFGTVGFGSKVENFEIGLAYELAKNTEVNVSYKSLKYKDLQLDLAGAPKYDLKVNGIAAGITYKF